MWSYFRFLLGCLCVVQLWGVSEWYPVGCSLQAVVENAGCGWDPGEEKRRGREGKGTSELRWQIKVDCVHTKEDSMLQTILMFCSVIALPTHLLLHLPAVFCPSSLCRRWWCVATPWRWMWRAAWTSTSALPRCSSFSSFSGTTWWGWTLQRKLQRYTRTHLWFQLTIINMLIINVLPKRHSLSLISCGCAA